MGSGQARTTIASDLNSAAIWPEGYDNSVRNDDGRARGPGKTQDCRLQTTGFRCSTLAYIRHPKRRATATICPLHPSSVRP